jgi:hypothetical protein
VSGLIHFVDQAADRITLGPPVGDDEARLAAKCVSRHVADGAVVYELLDMLGLPPVLFAIRDRARHRPVEPSGRAAGRARRTVGKARP